MIEQKTREQLRKAYFEFHPNDDDAGFEAWLKSVHSLEYVSEVRKFGGAEPYSREGRSNCRLDQKTQFEWSDVQTDGVGNIVQMPLLKRKPCFGRPERFSRGALEKGDEFTDSDGELRHGKTRCDRCPVFDACGRVAQERVDSASKVRDALDQWLDGLDEAKISHGSKRAFIGHLGKLWGVFLDAIIEHGGWTTCNDENIKLDELQSTMDRNKKQRQARKRKRAEANAYRKGLAKPISDEYLRALEIERDHRAEQLKRLRSAPNAERWLTKLPDNTCDRIAEVWASRELLKRKAIEPTGRKIKDLLASRGRTYGLKPSSLASRVYEDLKRIEKLEKDNRSGAIWEDWRFE